MVSKVAQETGMTAGEADVWLSAVWDSMFLGDEVQGRPAARDRLRAWLEAQPATAGAPTLPRAFTMWATA